MTRDDLRARREALGATQKQMADMLGVPLRTYASWEIGETVKIPVLVEPAMRELERQRA